MSTIDEIKNHFDLDCTVPREWVRALVEYVEQAEEAFGQFYPDEASGKWDKFKAARRKLGLK